MERPPPLRLYIVTDGLVLYRGDRLHKGDSWGANDVMTHSRVPERCVRALAITYLHTLWIGLESFQELEALPECREGFRLTRCWTTIHSVGENMLRGRRKLLQQRFAMRIGTGGPHMIEAATLEKRINAGGIQVVAKQPVGGGTRQLSANGEPLYCLRFHTVDLTGYEIIKNDGQFMVRSQTDGATCSHVVDSTNVAEAQHVGAAQNPQDTQNEMNSMAHVLKGEFGAELVDPACNGASSSTDAPMRAKVAALASAFQAHVKAQDESQRALAEQLSAIASDLDMHDLGSCRDVGNRNGACGSTSRVIFKASSQPKEQREQRSLQA